ncbi:peptidoglycan recognition protein family protein [Aquibacillus sediminis]|uniref:peptidoglycan recognition protein family protein n=1 Tax=Aquibacillus sediminis TaxID=2574734 RepID=UPI0011081620|nr:LysM peptidoglycan-binding domain-containing protein [Aquibacillus sediminis]
MIKRSFLLLSMVLLMLMHLTPVAVYATNNPRNTYEVQPGDHLSGIADTYQTSVENLKQINGLQSDTILVGQKLRVPIMYEVEPGDTLWDLAQSFNSSVQSIKETTGLTSNQLFVGQIVKIPPKKLSMQGQYVLMTREDFKDWLFNHEFTRNIRTIQHHHTYQPSYQQFDGTNHFSLLKGMEEHHKTAMNWRTISQQLTTFPDGTVAVGRPFDMPPEGSFGLNDEAIMHAIEANALAIENVGDFDEDGNQMTAEQRETIITVTALLMLRFGLVPSIDSITYHHWWDINTGERVLDHGEGHAVKTCPGTAFFGGNSTTHAKSNFYPLVLQKMQEIRATMQ